MIGIFGGTFDPVHYGHLRAAVEVKTLFGLDEVRLLPSAQPPHRLQPVASARLRAQMISLAIAKQPDLVLDTREFNRSGPSYMVDTLQSFHEEFPEQTLLLFIGTDAFNHLSTWYQWQRLFTYAHIVVITRPGFVGGQLCDFFNDRLVHHAQELAEFPSGKLFFQAITQLDISASAIRNIFANHQDPSFLLPQEVIDYIQQHQLYEQH